MNQFKRERLDVKVYDTREAMGIDAAREAGTCIKEMLKRKSSLNIIFAAAPSQNEFLAALRQDKEIPWERINAFHMDEYVGLKQGSQASFSGFLNEAIFLKVPFKSVNCLIGDGTDPEEECIRYSRLLLDNQANIVFMGIGENGHLAFNDPGVADFNDSKIVKIVELDLACRQQQVNDGCFPSLTDVPTHAYTVTIPALIQAERIFCIVPGERKAEAVARTLNGSMTEECPASILRKKENACLYLDQESWGKLG